MCSMYCTLLVFFPPMCTPLDLCTCVYMSFSAQRKLFLVWWALSMVCDSVSEACGMVSVAGRLLVAQQGRHSCMRGCALHRCLQAGTDCLHLNWVAVVEAQV